MNAGRCVYRSNLDNGCLKIGDRIVNDAVVGAERPFRRIDAPFVRWADESDLAGFIPIGPQSLGADAMVEPALHGAATARSFIIFARPFVVNARDVIEHARTDRIDVFRHPRFDAVTELKVIDQGCEAESGARTFGALVENKLFVMRQMSRDPILRRITRGQSRQTGVVDAIPHVRAVGANVERPATESSRCHRTLQRNLQAGVQVRSC